MKRENIIREKSYAFALRVVKLYSFLCKEKQEYILAKQILRSGTSIGALVRECEHAESKADFIHKLSIALKEANETEYWLNILKDTNYITEPLYLSLNKDLEEILKLLTRIVKTSKLK